MSPSAATVMACVLNVTQLPVPDVEAVIERRAPTAREAALAGTPAAVAVYLVEGALVVVPVGRDDLLAHELCHHAQARAGRRLDEAECEMAWWACGRRPFL